jgi:hypothetical protein
MKPYKMRVPRKCTPRCYLNRVLPALLKKHVSCSTYGLADPRYSLSTIFVITQHLIIPFLYISLIEFYRPVTLVVNRCYLLPSVEFIF